MSLTLPVQNVQAFSLDQDECRFETPQFHYSAMVDKEKGHFKTLLSNYRHATIVYCLVFWSFGVCVGFLGPTLWDLGCQTGTILPTMTWVFFCQTLFILIGSVVAGLVVKHLSPNPVLLVSMIGIGITLAAIPFCKSMLSLAVVLALMGLSMGLIDTTANVSMIRLYRSDVSPFLQALHFFYGLGAFLSPMIADPFLDNFDCTKLIEPNSTSTSFFEISDTPSQVDSANQPATLAEARKDLKVDKAFWIMCIIQLPVIAALIWLMVKERREANDIAERTDLYEDIDATHEPKPMPTSTPPLWIRCWTQNTCGFITIICFACMVLFLSDGMQAAYGSFVFSYAKLDIKGITSAEAAMINALFWGTFSVGRLAAIFTALYLQPSFMLFVDIIGTLVAVVLMVLSPHSGGLLFLGTALFGFSLASVSPSTISLVEQFIEIGPSATSVLVVGAATGEMVFPLVVGNLLDKFGPISFLVFGNVIVCTMLFAYLALLITGLYENKHVSTQSIVKLLCPWFFPPDQPEEPSEYTVIRPSYKRFDSQYSPSEPYQSSGT